MKVNVTHQNDCWLPGGGGTAGRLKSWGCRWAVAFGLGGGGSDVINGTVGGGGRE